MLEHWPKVISLEKPQAVQSLVTKSLGIRWCKHVHAAWNMWNPKTQEPDRKTGLFEAAPALVSSRLD